ncbi:type II toxin-antitoxin system PemK/MazF family toxin [Blastochloris tepida]|nr:type II toxin-antitoxin system PemK/MazF family toxin [Blastochloris tepida]
MVKRRPAVVISPRLRHRDGLCTVVPLSTTPPAQDVPYVVHVRLAAPLPAPFDALEMWAKCDMVATVGFCRLDLFRTGRDAAGRRKYLQPKLGRADFERIQRGVLTGLGLLHLTFNQTASHSG